MALFDDVVKGWGPSILIGVGLALAVPIILPAIGAVARPLAKELIKGYLMFADKVKEMAAEAGEQLSDVVAEVQAERAGSGAPMQQ
jgi:uncharacterized protein DUF5132